MSVAKINASKRSRSFLDRALTEIDTALRTLTSPPPTTRPRPDQGLKSQLSPHDAKKSAALMRINHVGEICAQALYRGQAYFSKDTATYVHLLDAAREEAEHLNWCQHRLSQLNSRPSLLNPLWYGASFGIGATFALLGDGISLGFVEETEYQVVAHLDEHLEKLPPNDKQSRAIILQMKQDESHHAQAAKDRGATTLPKPIKKLMRLKAKVMTRTAYYL